MKHWTMAEGREFRKLPQLPNFVSNEFFFQFDFTSPERQVYYSGLYLDLGGQGVVATITVPFVDPASGLAGVLGTDIAFDMDWPAFAVRTGAARTPASARAALSTPRTNAEFALVGSSRPSNRRSGAPSSTKTQVHRSGAASATALSRQRNASSR